MSTENDKMIQPNPEIEVIIDSATAKAKYYNHEYVTLEHILYGIITYEPFGKLLDNYGVDIQGMSQDVEIYLAQQTFLISEENTTPRRTHSVERVLNRALTQVLFSSRRSLTVIDLVISISQETNSQAAYFLLKYGIEDRDELIEYYNHFYNAKTGRKTANDKKATDILNEYCTDLNALALEGKIDPVIGREYELEEITHVLALSLIHI